MTKNEAIVFTGSCGILGLLFMLVPPAFLAPVYFSIVSIGFILMGIVKLVFANRILDTRKEYIFNMLEGSIAILMGVIYFNFYTYLIIDIIAFLALLVIPVLRLVTSEHVLNQVLFDILKYIGIISLLGGYAYLNKVFFIVFGAIWTCLGIYILVNYFIVKRRGMFGKED